MKGHVWNTQPCLVAQGGQMTTHDKLSLCIHSLPGNMLVTITQCCSALLAHTHPHNVLMFKYLLLCSWGEPERTPH